METITYTPLSEEYLHIWDQTCEIDYRDMTMNLEYYTEPPHGDFIYSVTLHFNESQHDRFPYVIYGRSLYFYSQYIVLEGMDAKLSHKAPLQTILIDCNLKQYGVIDEWYCQFSREDASLRLHNPHTKRTYILQKPSQLTWHPICL